MTLRTCNVSTCIMKCIIFQYFIEGCPHAHSQRVWAKPWTFTDPTTAPVDEELPICYTFKGWFRTQNDCVLFPSSFRRLRGWRRLTGLAPQGKPLKRSVSGLSCDLLAEKEPLTLFVTVLQSRERKRDRQREQSFKRMHANKCLVLK